MKNDASSPTNTSNPEQPEAVDLTDTLSAKEVSLRLGIHRDEVYRMANAGELPSITISRRRRRFPRAWLQTYLRNLAIEQGIELNQYDEVA